VPDMTSGAEETEHPQWRPHGAWSERVHVPSTWRGPYRDGGILDFGRDHAFLDERDGRVIILPEPLVQFIQSLKREQSGG